LRHPVGDHQGEKSIETSFTKDERALLFRRLSAAVSNTGQEALMIRAFGNATAVLLATAGFVKQISAKPILLAATVFAYGTLAPVDCEGLPADIETARAKLGRPADPTSVGGTTRRKRHRTVSGGEALHKTSARDSIVGSKSALGRQLAIKQDQKTHLRTNREAARSKKRHRLASGERFSKTQAAMLGLASFYSEDTETASGESFDKHKLTAAHPTLPFGTRLRVTNVRNGRSVTVRVNDRGPFVRGRVVDVTSAAAEALGMLNQGVVTVMLDVVR
jgi:rare lipoprotein A